MKFILNTAVDPHFCTLFTKDGKRFAHHEWTNRRRDGVELWIFLNNYTVSEFTFLGGISGPGGFSSLRAGAGVLNALSFATRLPIYSVRADKVQRALLPDSEVEVVLNSFGEGVWIQEGSELVRKEMQEVHQLFAHKRACTSWLPFEKESAFPHSVSVDTKTIPEVLLRLLEVSEPQKVFVPDYEVPAVE